YIYIHVCIFFYIGVVLDIENKIEQLKNVEYHDSILTEINELSDKALKLKENISNAYFQYLRHSSVIISEKKLKELIKEIESIKYIYIQKRNSTNFGQFKWNYNKNLITAKDDVLEEEETDDLTDIQITRDENSLSFENLKNERIIRCIGEIKCSSLLLSNLDNCEVIILDVLSSVLIKQIKNCTICVPAIESSLLIYNCQDCNILTNSQQVRIHDTSNTKFYINSMSSPIIESSDKLVFSRYNLNYDGLSEILKKIHIDENSNTWSQILDFNWQNVQEPSPNFSIINEQSTYEIKLKKRDTIDENNCKQVTTCNYIIEKFPEFLKKID
uniref:C-CAP/cofactor C-like domain-containing protein n=1 Tax=Piliocolobus tephrosceles TaxID=591936 RepID=A0A8C9HDB8_9PRIM